jgi:hypothetical protein
MAEPLDRERNDPARPIGSVADVVDDTLDPDESKLPDHEIDEDATIGGGILSEGGTAIDRGTGTLDGQAEGQPPRDDDPLSGPDDEPDEVMPSPQSHG